MFILTVQYSVYPSILPPLNHLSHTCKLNGHKIIHHVEISLLAVWSALACQTSFTWWYFTPTWSAAVNRKLCLIPNWQEFPSKGTFTKVLADSADRSYLLLEMNRQINLWSHTWCNYPTGMWTASSVSMFGKDGDANQLTWTLSERKQSLSVVLKTSHCFCF